MPVLSIRRAVVVMLAVLVFSPSVSRAQKVEVTPFVGYQFGGEVPVRDGNLRIGDDMNYGLSLDVTVRRNGQVQASYTRSDTQLFFDEYRVGKRAIYDVSVNYWQVGGLYRFNPTATVRPFLSLTLGATHFGVGDKLDPAVRNLSSDTFFSMVLGGGVKIFPSQRIGVRLQGHLYSTILDSSSGFWCSFPGGCGVGLSGWSVFQGDVSAGLTVAM